jgi:hypothetical protein
LKKMRLMRLSTRRQWPHRAGAIVWGRKLGTIDPLGGPGSFQRERRKSLGDLFSFSGGYSASRDQLSTEGALLPVRRDWRPAGLIPARAQKVARRPVQLPHHPARALSKPYPSLSHQSAGSRAAGFSWVEAPSRDQLSTEGALLPALMATFTGRRRHALISSARDNDFAD